MTLSRISFFAVLLCLGCGSNNSDVKIPERAAVLIDDARVFDGLISAISGTSVTTLKAMTTVYVVNDKVSVNGADYIKVVWSDSSGYVPEKLLFKQGKVGVLTSLDTSKPMVEIFKDKSLKHVGPDKLDAWNPIIVGKMDDVSAQVVYLNADNAPAGGYVPIKNISMDTIDLDFIKVYADASRKMSNGNEEAMNSLKNDPTFASRPIYQLMFHESKAAPKAETNRSLLDSLNTHFTQPQIEILRSARAEYDAIRSASDLAQYYSKTLPKVIEIMNKQIEAITPTETSGDDSPSARWNWFSDYFPETYSSVDCSECSYEAKINLSPLTEKAASTPEKEDDDFFEMANSFNDGKEVYYKLIGCDFCAASLLGSGERANALEKIDKSNLTKGPFAEKVNSYLRGIINVEDERYAYSRAKVLEELDRIIKSTSLTSEDRNALIQSRKKIKDSTEIYFNCETEDCKWPTY